MMTFNYTKSDHITFLTRIINDMIEEVRFEKDDIISKSKELFDYSDKEAAEFADSLTAGEDDIKKCVLFSDDGGEIVFRPCSEEMCENDDIGIPPLLSKTERRYLKTIMNDPLFRALSGDVIFRKLEAALKDTEPYDWNDFFSYRLGKPVSRVLFHSPELAEKIAVIVKAIREHRAIQYINHAHRGDIESEAYPYRIMYSRKRDSFQVLMYLADEERVILANIYNLEDISVTDKVNCDVDKKAMAFLEKRKQSSEPLVLELDVIYRSVERCFSLFVSYEKSAVYDEKTKKHTIKINYYDFDEEEIIRSILSLGDAVKVISPAKIRSKVIEEIKKSAENYR